MGVWGLTKFLEGKPVWENIELSNTRLVIDGSALYYYLYKTEKPSTLDFVHCGQYRDYAQRVRRFFENLDKHAIIPYVVMDGVYDGDKKLDTIINRTKSVLEDYDKWFRRAEEDQKKDLTGAPSLARYCFVQTLHEMDVHIVIADYEADREVAALSREWSCPAVSNDSDFFIFNTGQYYIPLDTLTSSVDTVTCKACQSGKVAELLGVSVDLLPLLASISGNDYTRHHSFPLNQIIKKGGNKFVELGKVLSAAQTTGEGLASVNRSVSKGRKIQLHDISDSLKEYEIPEQSYLKGWFESGTLQTTIKADLPEWLLRLFREGKFPGQFLEIVCNHRAFLDVKPEDMRADSSHRCSSLLRQDMYKMLFPQGHSPFIMEWDRQRKSFKKRRIVLTADQPGIALLPSVYNADPKDKGEALLKTLNVSISTDIPDEWMLPVAVLKYWYKNAISSIGLKHLEALLIVHATSIQMNIPQSQHIFDPQTLHAFAQWKSVLKTVICMNSLLNFPFPSPCIEQLFDGPTAFQVFIKLKNGETVEIENEEEGCLLEMLKRAVLEDLGDSKLDMNELVGFDKHDTGARTDDVVKPSRAKAHKRRELQQYSVCVSNSFSALPLDDDE